MIRLALICLSLACASPAAHAVETCLARQVPSFDVPSFVKKAWGDAALTWPKGRMITLRFMGGDANQRAIFMQRVRAIDALAKGLTVGQVKAGKADIRVRFDLHAGHWSFIGTDSARLPQSQASMNIALSATAPGPEWTRVVYHEFFHGIGFGHELQSPKSGIQWNKPVVLRDYAAMGWTAAEVNAQVFKRDHARKLVASPFDPTSIMCYPVPKEHTLDGFSAPWNSTLSRLDVLILKRLYP